MNNSFENLFPSILYHSYIIEGDPIEVESELLNFLKIRGEIKDKYSDIFCRFYESFTMENSGEIKDWHSKRGVSGGKKICIISTKFINREAEQALLKLIEEPFKNTHFFIVIPKASLLLDTVLSRTHIIKTEQITNKNFQKHVLEFIESTPKDRIKKISEIIKENKDEENSGKLRFYATTFVNELEKNFYQKFKKEKKNKKIEFVLNEVSKARGHLSTSGASVKMILEHLALVI